MSPEDEPAIGAVIAAAGLSTRMGKFKQLLPWGERTVIETVVSNLDAAGARPVVCVVGHLRYEMEAVLAASPALIVFNEAYVKVEMVRSFQVGITRLVEDATYFALAGTLLALGDQPHVGPEIIRKVVDAAKAAPDNIMIPSHNMRRGHPIYVPRTLWTDLLTLGKEESLRVLLKKHDDIIHYVTIADDLILDDMDTPTEYERLQSTRSSGRSSGRSP